MSSLEITQIDNYQIIANLIGLVVDNFGMLLAAVAE